MVTLAVAALSARMMAESAAQAGFHVIALDLFGDRDTRRASTEWLPIGAAGGLRIDTEQTLAALHGLARRGDVTGWVAGSGFEGLPALLEQGADMLPRIGTTAAAVRRVRNPLGFFGFLDAVHIGHPPICFEPPADPANWLIKNALGTGGWHIRDAHSALDAELPEHSYFQRRAPGTPMSATFIANGSDVCVLGFNDMIVRRRGALPFVFCGAVGPVLVAAEVARQVTRALRLLVTEFSLRGLGSLDFMLHGDSMAVLELNPRPSASMGSYSQHLRQGLMAAHVRACVQAELPQPATTAQQLHGTETVFARHPLLLDEPASARLAQWPHAHDLPFAGAAFAAGDPVCSVSASGTSAGQVRTQLTERREALLNNLEIWA